MGEISSNSSEEPSSFVANRSVHCGKSLQVADGIFREYCNNSTIHGIRYIGDRHRSTSERLFWISVLTISIGICGHLIRNIWNHWNDSPLIVSFTERTGLISEIPFPSVLICPEIKAHNNAFDFLKVVHILKDDEESLNNLTTTENLYLNAFLHLCKPKIPKKFKLANNTSNNPWESIEKMSLELYDTLSYTTSFKNDVFVLEDVFEKVITENGACFYFNALHYIHSLRLIDYPNADQEIDSIGPPWSAEEGYRYNNAKYAFPRPPSTNLKESMNFQIYGERNETTVCPNAVPGARIYLLSPSDLPQGQWHYVKVPFDSEVTINIRPNFIFTSQKARGYIPQRRGCFFENERYLRFFKIYTQSNCNYECLINHTISSCGCVAFHMPVPFGIRSCQVDDIPCYSQADSDLVYKEFERGLKSLQRNEYFKTECNCLPACASLEYDFTISVDYINWKELEEVDYPVSNVFIKYDKKYFPVIQKNYEELYKTIDFLANCGNFFGLFMGVSVLSVVEFIYFFTFRLVANIKMHYSKQVAIKFQSPSNIQ